MIIYSDNELKLIETCSIYPNSDWTGKAEYVIDESNPDNQVLIKKIIEYTPYFDYVLDDDGNLIDVIKTGEKSIYKNPMNNSMNTLIDENKVINAKVQALTESNQFLEDCIVEMSEVLYD